MMSKVIKLTVAPFDYKFTLQDNILHIEAKHTEDCLVWATIIEDSLEDSNSMKKEVKPQKQFVINLDPEEIFDLFDYYVKKELDVNTQITFPKMYKTENDHLCIVIDFQMSFGKQRCDTKWIMLNAEPIPKDTIIFQKLENLKNKMGTQMEDISTTLGENQTEICALKEEICAMKAEMATLLKLNGLC
jgi:hypothetical protein